jgi:uncharacterized protein (TIGR01777 family)
MANTERNNESILIAGGSGAVGKNLCNLLAEAGYEVRILTRNPEKNSSFKAFKWDIKSGEIDSTALENVKAVINLAGENIGNGRWSSKRKKAILKSRTESTKLLSKAISGLSQKPEVYISASAVGIYGSRTTENRYDEDSKPGYDFLAGVVKKWEGEVDEISKLGIRTVKLRTAVVIDPADGVLPKFLIPKRSGFLNYFGSGKQYMPWIDVRDLASAYKFAVETDSLEGAFNVAAPQHLNQKQFVEALNKHTGGKSTIAGVPGFLMRIALGEQASIVLEGSRVSGDKLIKAGFEYQFKDIDSCLGDIFSE